MAAAAPFDAEAATIRDVPPPTEEPPAPCDEQAEHTAPPAREATKPLYQGEVSAPYAATLEELARLEEAGLSDIVAIDDETDTSEGYDGRVGSRTRIISRGVSGWWGTTCYIVTDATLTPGERHRLQHLRIDVVLCRDEVELLTRSAVDMARLVRYATPPGLRPLLVTFNGAYFDWALTRDRAEANGVDLARLGLHIVANGGAAGTPDGYAPLKNAYSPMEGHDCGYEATWHGADHVDLMQVHVDLHGRQTALKSATEKMLGLTPVRVDYDRMDELTLGQLTAYTASDVIITRQLGFHLLDGVLARVPSEPRRQTDAA